MPPRRRGLLSRRGAFTRLWLARLISFVGDALAAVALIIHLQEKVGTGTAAGLLLVVEDGIPGLASPLLGAVADRFDPRRVMLVCETGQGVAMTALALHLPALAPLLVVVGARALLFSAFRPAAFRTVPALVDDADLPAANALLGAGTHGASVVGPLLAAAVIPALGVRGALALDAATFAAAIPLLATLPRRPARAEPSESVKADVREGLRALAQHPVAAVVTAGFALYVLLMAIDDVVLVFLARGPLHAGERGASALYAASAAGMLLSFVVLARAGRRAAPAALFVVGLALQATGNLATGLAPTLAVAFLFQAARGLGIGPVDVGSSTLIQRSVPAAHLGRVYANLYGALGLCAAASYLAGGPLLDATSPRAVLVGAASGALAATAVTGILLARRAPRGEHNAGDGRSGR